MTVNDPREEGDGVPDLLVEFQDAVLAHLKETIPQPVYEQAVPDAANLRKVNGKLLPYVALQFGDLQRKAGGNTFAGVRTYDYELPIYVQVCAADPSTARRIASGKVLDALLGLSGDGTGEVRKRPGGGMFPVVNSNAATEAYLFPSSWAVTLQISHN